MENPIYPEQVWAEFFSANSHRQHSKALLGRFYNLLTQVLVLRHKALIANAIRELHFYLICFRCLETKHYSFNPFFSTTVFDYTDSATNNPLSVVKNQFWV